MRLIRRKLWRAFPELDTIDDELCRAFVRVATASWRAKGLRVLVLGRIVLATLAVALLAAQLTADAPPARRLNTPVQMALVGTTVTIVLAAGFLAALVARDWLLRRRVRRVIRDHGGCAHCGYRLLGTPVTDDLRATCPECGNVTVVDAAMGELAPGAGGKRTFTPVRPRDDQRGRRRRRGFALAAASAAATLGGVLALSYGVWSIILHKDAAQARADRSGARVWRQVIRDAQPIPGATPVFIPAPGQDLAAINGWPELQTLLEEMERRTLKLGAEAGNKLRRLHGSVPWVDFTAITPPAATSKPRRVSTPQADDHDARVERELAMTVFTQLREAGMFERLSRVRNLAVVMRPVVEVKDPDGIVRPLVNEIDTTHLARFRQAARLSATRMHLALLAGDRAEYVDALDTRLALARILDTQSTLIDRLVGNAVEALILGTVVDQIANFPDAAWTLSVREVLAQRAQRLGLDHAIRGESVLTREWLAWFFSKPGTVRRAVLLGDISAITGSWLGRGPVARPIFDLGRYQSNLSTLDNFTAGWSAYAAAEPWQRPPSPPSAGTELPPLLEALAPRYVQVVAGDDQLLLQRRHIALLLAIRHYEQRTGAPPARAQDLVPGELARLPTDPTTGRPLVFVALPPGVVGGQPWYDVLAMSEKQWLGDTPGSPRTTDGSVPPAVVEPQREPAPPPAGTPQP